MIVILLDSALEIAFRNFLKRNKNIKLTEQHKHREPHSPLDDVIGDNGWRQFETGKEIIEYYRNKLVSLGYQEVKLGEEIPIRSITKNLPLYCLLFACKHPLGHKFWQEISKIDHRGQRRLF